MAPLPTAITNILGSFPGDDVKLASVRDILDNPKTYIRNKKKLLKALFTLPFRVRMTVMSLLARDNDSSEMEHIISEMMGEAEESGAMTDSDDEDMVVVFGGKSNSAVKYDERQLAIQAAVVGQHKGKILTELDATSLCMKKLVSTSACKSKTRQSKRPLVSDDELLARICKGPNCLPLARHRLLQQCVANRRTAVVDAALLQMVLDEEPVAHYLSGASAEVVRRLLPTCMNASDASALRWRNLWRFHEHVLLDVLQQELVAANVDKKTTVWSKWESLLAHTKRLQDKNRVYNLYVMHPRCSVIYAKKGAEKKKLQEAMTITAANSKFYVVEAFPQRLCRLVIEQLSVQDLFAKLRALATARTPSCTRWTAWHPQLFKALKQVPLKTISRHFHEFIAFVRAMLATYSAPQIFAATSEREVLRTCEYYIKVSTTASAQSSKASLDAMQLLAILATMKEFAARFTPLRDLFGISAAGATCEMLPTLVSGSTILAHIKQWVALLTPCTTAVLTCLVAKYNAAKKAQRPLHDLNQAIHETITDNYLWSESVLHDARDLQSIWPSLKSYFDLKSNRLLNQYTSLASTPIPPGLESHIHSLLKALVGCATAMEDLEFLKQPVVKSLSKETHGELMELVVGAVHRIRTTVLSSKQPYANIRGALAMAKRTLTEMMTWQVLAPEVLDPCWKMLTTLNGDLMESFALDTEYFQLLCRLPHSTRENEAAAIQKLCKQLKPRELASIGHTLASNTLSGIPGVRALIVRTLRARADVALHHKNELLRYCPMIDIGARVGLEAACKTKIPQERIDAMTVLIDTTFDDYNPTWTGTTNPTDKHFLADRATLARDGIKRTLKFLIPKIANEQLGNRAQLIDHLKSKVTMVVIKHYLPPPDAIADIQVLADEITGTHHDLWVQLFSDTLASIAGSIRSSSVENCLHTLQDLAREFVNAAMRWAHVQPLSVDFAARRPLVQSLVRLGLSLDWMVQVQSKSEVELQANFKPHMSSTPYTSNNCRRNDGFIPALVDVLLDETCARLGCGPKETVLQNNLNLLLVMVKSCSCNYVRVPALRDAVMHLARDGPLDNEDTRDIFESIARFPYPYLDTLPDLNHDSHACPPWVDDAAMNVFTERLFRADIPDASDASVEEFVDDWKHAVKRITKLRVGERPVAVGRGAYRLPRVSRQERQHRCARLAAEFMDVCPVSAIHTDVVRKHVLQWRDDVLDLTHLASDTVPTGVFAHIALPSENESWRLTVPTSLLPALARIPAAKLAHLHKSLLADAADTQLPVRDRTLAAAAAIALPSCGLSDVQPFLQDATASEDTRTVPPSVSMALLRGVLQCDDRTEPLRYLLSPARIALVDALGIRPMHVVSSAARLLPPSGAVHLMQAFLRDDVRTNAIGVSGQKQLVRLLYSIGTPDAHALLLQCWAWPTLTHTDVKIEVLHAIVSMLDHKHQPTLLVPEDAVWEVLEAVTANSATVTAEMKATLLRVLPAGTLQRKSCPASGRLDVSLPCVPVLMQKMTDAVASLSTVTLHTMDRCQRFARLLLQLITRINTGDISAMLDEVAEAEELADNAMDTGTDGDTADDNEGSQRKTKKREIEKLRRRAMKVMAFSDLRALALVHLVQFAGCEGTPNDTDKLVETQLLTEVCSFDAPDIDQDSANHKDRTRYLVRAVPKLFVHVSAHHAMTGYPDLGAAVENPLTMVIDLLLGKLLNFTLPRNQRYAASMRLNAIHESLEEGTFLRYPRHYTDPALRAPSTAEQNRVTMYVTRKLLHARCGEPLAFLNEERRILDIFSTIPTCMMNLKSFDAATTTSPDDTDASSIAIAPPAAPWQWDPTNVDAFPVSSSSRMRTSAWSRRINAWDPTEN
eukprot:m.1114187 g.1114187  ORF g.1114187 m.1114187 type:complete len:1857 (-) comp24365_c0_seq2:104-5674(-)